MFIKYDVTSMSIFHENASLNPYLEMRPRAIPVGSSKVTFICQDDIFVLPGGAHCGCPCKNLRYYQSRQNILKSVGFVEG